MQTPKLIPFKQIKPVKFIGINSDLPFTSLICESKIIYLCGRSIILENIKTYEQKIIWTNQFIYQPEVIQHIINVHRQNVVGIAIKDDSDTNMIIIMNINSQINNYEHLNKKQRQKDRFHYLKNISSTDSKVQMLKFLHEGSLFAVVASNLQQNHQNHQNQSEIHVNHAENTFEQNRIKRIFIYSSSTGDTLYNCAYQANFPLIEPLQLNRLNYTCVIRNKPEKNLEDSFNLLKRVIYTKQSQTKKQNAPSLFKISLLNSSELSTKNDFMIQLKSGQTILQIKFFENHKKTFAFFLLSSGFVLIYMVNQRGFHDCIRIDVRIDKAKYINKMKTQKQKIFFSSEKTQPNQQGNTIDIQLAETNKVNSDQKPIIVSHEQNFHSKKPSFGSMKNSEKPTENLIQKNESQFYYPICICCTSCKVVIGYEKCSFIGLISYSAVDHRNYKFSFIFDFFFQKSHIQSIQKINFSQDGCHCSVLAKVLPNKVEPARKKRNSTKIQNRFKTSQKLFSQNNKLNSKSNLKSCCLKQKRAIIDSSVSITPKQLILQEVQSQQKQFFQVFHIDFISGMIQHEYHNEAIQESLTKSSLKGTVQAVSFNQMNNTMLILMTCGALYYYYLNLTNVNNEKDFLTGGRSSLLTLRKKLETNNFFKQKSLQNYLSPESILLWVEKIKIKPFLIVCHPIIFQIVLVFQDNVKFHFYNYDKMFECHHVLSLKSCKAASYSPFGDKLALGTVGSIWLLDSYTHHVLKKISLVIFPTAMKKQQQRATPINTRRSQSIFASLSSKTVSKIQYINNEDIILQTGNITFSMLLNYDKVLYYGSTQTVEPQLACYDYKHRLGVVATENCVKIITKCNINSKNKCEELAKIDLAITAIKLCGQIDILFLGGQNGILYFIRWPQFFQNDNIKAPNTTNKLHLFHSPIVKIQISINYRQLFVVSKEGMIIICQLTHSDQVEKIGKDVSFRMSKKIDLPLPLHNKWLVSIYDEEKRAQNITKLMGNQAQIKNNEVILAEDYRNLLQQRSTMQRQKFDGDLKTQIRKYQVDSGISKLQLQIASVKDQLKRISGKRQVQIKEINQKIDSDLHKIFIERQKFQKQLKQLQAKSINNKAQFIEKQNSEHKQFQLLTKQQTLYQKARNEQQEKMYQQKFKVDRALDENFKQDFLDQKQEIQKHYGQILQDLYQKNNVLMSENRNKKVQIIEVSDKMRELSTRMQQLQADVQELEKQRKQVDQTTANLSQRIVETDKKYHSLIKRTKQFETSLNHIRASSEACQLKHDDLQAQIEVLSQKWNYFEERRQEAQIDFIDQFKIRSFNTTQTSSIKQKINQLKQKRKIAFDNNVLVKDLIKMYEPNVIDSKAEFLSKQVENQQRQLPLISSSLIDFKKDMTTKLTSDVEKWTHVKDDSKAKFIRYNKKMEEQNNKLIYRFNQLQKQFKEWVKLEKKLKNQIILQKQSKKSSLHSSANHKFSFIKGQQDEDHKQRNSHSLKRQPLTQNKFTVTSCHFNSPKSLPRQINPNIQNNPNKLQQINTLHRNKQLQKIPSLKKVKVQNIYGASFAAIEKGMKLKQQKENLKQQLKYHGVMLNKETLKPKKTLCLSLHQDGQEKGKFVTEY